MYIPKTAELRTKVNRDKAGRGKAGRGKAGRGKAGQCGSGAGRPSRLSGAGLSRTIFIC